MRLGIGVMACLTLLLFGSGCGGMMGGGGAQQNPEMSVSGTLTRAQAAGGQPGDYYLTGMMGMNYKLVNMPTGAEAMIGKQVAVTGNMDSSASGAGGMTIKVRKIEVLEGAPANQGTPPQGPAGGS